MATRDGRLHVVVIGGGIAGLTAAATAAKGGARVTVVERSHALGGRGASDRSDGFSLNLGPHALYARGEAAAALAELGVAVPGRRAGTGARALVDGALHQLPVGVGSLVGTGLLGAGDKAAVGRWLASIALSRAERLGTETVDGFLDSTGLRGTARSLLGAYLRLATYVNAPERFSAATAVRKLQQGSAGVLYVDGGWQTIVDGLAAALSSAGGVVRQGARATALEPRGPTVRVSFADHDPLDADRVILALPPDAAAALVASAGAAVPAGIEGAVPVHAATLDLALARLPSPHEQFVLGVDRPLYLSVHSTVAKLAPGEGAVVHLARYLPTDGSRPAEDRAELEALADLSMPGWREHVVRARFLPRMTVAERLDLAEEGGAAGRPRVAVPGLPSVFLAGDWVRSGSWLVDAAVASARAAAFHALGDPHRMRDVA